MNLVRHLLLLVVVPLVGCGGQSSSTGVAIEDSQSFRSAAALYGLYQQEHGGKAPVDEQAFRAFIETKQDVLQRIGKSVDELLTSPRNGEPLIFVYGKNPLRGPGGVVYLAYEKTPVNGKRLVIAGRGMFEEMDETQIKKIFPDAI